MSPTATEERSTASPLPAGMLITRFQFPSFPCQLMLIFSASQHMGTDQSSRGFPLNVVCSFQYFSLAEQRQVALLNFGDEFLHLTVHCSHRILVFRHLPLVPPSVKETAQVITAYSSPPEMQSQFIACFLFSCPLFVQQGRSSEIVRIYNLSAGCSFSRLPDTI